ncbi:MAG: hypothetical protein Q7S20_12890 [Gemmatimonadaceae bacterium]|nr:hypothetical protein [Gemmatimonadaceae bacterium]
MNDTITRFFGHTISSDAFDRRLGQVVCFVAGVVMVVVSLWKLTRLDLSEAQFFFGVLLSLCVPLLLVIVGLVLPIATTPRGNNIPDRE